MILVTGATGSIGRHLVRRLMEAKVPFRAMVRDQAQGRTLGCDFVVGDFEDPDSVGVAMVGIDRLFLNTSGAVPAVGEQPMVRHQKTAIDAAKSAGVGRIVKVSVWGARPGGKLAEGAHWEIERHLKASGLEWSLLQPSGFMQNFFTAAGAFAYDGDLFGTHGDTPVSYIDCYDIAACAARLLVESVGAYETFILTGPEAISQVEIAAKLSTVVGRSVKHVELSPVDMAVALTAQGLPRSFADDIVELWVEVGAGSLSAVTTAVRDLTGREPRAFDQFLRAYVPSLNS